jgi:hypothetical protein
VVPASIARTAMAQTFRPTTENLMTGP